MKILHIISSPAAGGAEIYVRDLLDKLNKRSIHQQEILFLYDAKAIGREEAFQANFYKILNASLIPYKHLGAKPGRHFSNLLKMFFFLLKGKYKVIHAHVPIALLYAFFSPVLIIYTHHTIKKLFPGFCFPFLKWRILKWVAICRSNEKMLKRNGVKKIVLINNGVEVGRFRDKPQFYIDNARSDKVEILCIGRHVNSKNYSQIIDLTEILLRDHKIENFRIRIAGGGEHRRLEKFREAVEEKGFSGYIELVGQVEDVRHLLHSSDIFVMCSVSEGLPISLIEATASGLPSVVTDVGGCAEVIDNCNSGFSVPVENTEMLAFSVSKLIEDPELRKRLSEQALINSSVYDINIGAEKHESMYRQALSDLGEQA